MRGRHSFGHGFDLQELIVNILTFWKQIFCRGSEGIWRWRWWWWWWWWWWWSSMSTLCRPTRSSTTTESSGVYLPLHGRELAVDEHGRIGEFFLVFFFLINDEHGRIGELLFFSLNFPLLDQWSKPGRIGEFFLPNQWSNGPLCEHCRFSTVFYFILDSVVPSLTNNESLLIN